MALFDRRAPVIPLANEDIRYDDYKKLPIGTIFKNGIKEPIAEFGTKYTAAVSAPKDNWVLPFLQLIPHIPNLVVTPFAIAINTFKLGLSVIIGIPQLLWKPKKVLKTWAMLAEGLLVNIVSIPMSAIAVTASLLSPFVMGAAFIGRKVHNAMSSNKTGKSSPNTQDESWEYQEMAFSDASQVSSLNSSQSADLYGSGMESSVLFESNASRALAARSHEKGITLKLPEWDKQDRADLNELRTYVAKMAQDPHAEAVERVHNALFAQMFDAYEEGEEQLTLDPLMEKQLRVFYPTLNNDSKVLSSPDKIREYRQIDDPIEGLNIPNKPLLPEGQRAVSHAFNDKLDAVLEGSSTNTSAETPASNFDSRIAQIAKEKNIETLDQPGTHTGERRDQNGAATKDLDPANPGVSEAPEAEHMWVKTIPSSLSSSDDSSAFMRELKQVLSNADTATHTSNDDNNPMDPDSDSLGTLLEKLEAKLADKPDAATFLRTTKAAIDSYDTASLQDLAETLENIMQGRKTDFTEEIDTALREILNENSWETVEEMKQALSLGGSDRGLRDDPCPR